MSFCISSCCFTSYCRVSSVSGPPTLVLAQQIPDKPSHAEAEKPLVMHSYLCPCLLPGHKPIRDPPVQQSWVQFIYRVQSPHLLTVHSLGSLPQRILSFCTQAEALLNFHSLASPLMPLPGPVYSPPRPAS